MAREIVIGTSHHYNWVCLGGAVNHPDQGKRLDLNADTNKHNNIEDASVILYPISGYGNPDLIRQMIKMEKPDALMIFTDPRYFTWLFEIEHEIRQQIPIIYYNIWDDLPYPMYNKSFYESCDGLLAISKQTENINRVVLGDKSKNKVIKYVPHGINENIFYPIDETHSEYFALEQFKKELYKGKEYKFSVLYNARNIRRKCTSDLLLAWKTFIDYLSVKEANECVIVLHTQLADENGTDLLAVKDMLFGNDPKYNIIFSNGQMPPQGMNLLYNSTDVTALISSNEGWGLSLTEARMSGKMIIGNVTGGMQDQMRFEDKNGEWLNFNPTFPSNHNRTYEKHAEWVLPVFPSNRSIVGSLPTPYIFDDRADFRDIAHALHTCWNLGSEKRKELGLKAREWVMSDESMQSARWMCKNMIIGIDETLQKWIPREKFELVNVSIPKNPKHYTGLPLIY